MKLMTIQSFYEIPISWDIPGLHVFPAIQIQQSDIAKAGMQLECLLQLLLVRSSHSIKTFVGSMLSVPSKHSTLRPSLLMLPLKTISIPTHNFPTAVGCQSSESMMEPQTPLPTTTSDNRSASTVT
jgi:hypothetical protein